MTQLTKCGRVVVVCANLRKRLLFSSLSRMAKTGGRTSETVFSADRMMELRMMRDISRLVNSILKKYSPTKRDLKIGCPTL